MMLQKFILDLHIHTCLSPCAEFEMTPRNIPRAALSKGLHGIAVCDHNSAKNTAVLRKTGQEAGLAVLSGIEITTSEEIHIIGVFDMPEQALAMQKSVYERLLPGYNDDELFGMQIVATADDEVEAVENRMLIGSTSLSLDETLKMIKDLNGLVIASHVDKESNSLIGQLGFIPDNCEIDALEISINGRLDDIQNIHGIEGYPVVRSSDAHHLNQIGRAYTVFELEQITVGELKKAFRNENGRRIVESFVAC
jgi:3',5'-nucleoside bisphosphate phosphatase